MQATPRNEADIGVCLWFDGQAEAAVAHYLDIFKDGRRLDPPRAPEDGPALTVAFELRGRRFVALNGGPMFKFSPAVSLVVDCADQTEIDYFWQRLCEGGAPSRCGWLADKFGLSWQIIPRALPQLLARGPAVMQALMKMDKLDIAGLQRAGETREVTP
jgi:predicted 3-demethylubiquinone-9 3-methyltransferase (glyoxalase superfamily)